jgi:hypothetical protein
MTTTEAAQLVTLETVSAKLRVPTLTAKRRSVEAPASRTGASARRAAALECFQRPTSVAATATR